MRISYNPLWKMLIDRGMNKKELRELSGISTASMAKLGICLYAMMKQYRLIWDFMITVIGEKYRLS